MSAVIVGLATLLSQSDSLISQPLSKTQKLALNKSAYKEFSTQEKLTRTRPSVVMLPELSARSKMVVTPEEFLSTMVCHVDAAIVGTALDSMSALTNESTTVFSDITVRVVEVLAGRDRGHVTEGAEITVTRPGGEVRIDGTEYSAAHLSFPPLEAGKQYILFLTYVQQSDSFKTKTPDAAFVITEGGNIAPTSPAGIPYDEAITASALSQIVRNVAAVCPAGR